MSVTTCPVFRPTPEEFSDFRAYISKIEETIDPDVGLCKIVPPSCFLKGKKYDLESLDVTVDYPVKQIVSGRAGVYNVALLEIKAMNLRDFAAYNAKNSINCGVTVVERERKFWKSMGVPAWEHPIYGADQEGTLFADDEGGAWNINRLDSIVSMLGSDVPGVSSAYLYVGTWRSLFAYHVEDLDLYSINYVHTGSEKSWYSVKYSQTKRFECFAESFFTAEHHKCNQFLRHKTAMFSPSKLREVGIEVTTCVQEAGEIVITFPGAYHAGFNHGFNIAESTNFATPRWFEIGRQAKRCVCRPHSVNINVLVLETTYLRKERQLRKDGGMATRPFRNRFRCSCGVNEVSALSPELHFECCACGIWGHSLCFAGADTGSSFERRCYICSDIDASYAACSEPVSVEGSPRKRKTDETLIFVGDKVQITLPVTGSDVIGTVTDIEDDLGRLHVKNTRKDNDLWFSLSECVVVERGRSSKFMVESYFDTPPLARGLAAEPIRPAKKAKKGPKRDTASHSSKGMQVPTVSPSSSSSSSSSAPKASVKTMSVASGAKKASDGLRAKVILEVLEDSVLLPDDLIEIHEQPICLMLEKLSPLELQHWIARVVLPLWTTSEAAPEYQHATHDAETIHEEESEALFRDLNPYLRTGRHVVVRHVILRILAAAVRRKVQLPLFLFK